MKLKKIITIILIFIFLLSVGVLATTENIVNDISEGEEIGEIAEDVKATDVGESNEIIDNDYFLLEENIVLENKTILGDAFLMGQTIDITNIEVSGSVYILAQNANISNIKTSGSLYIATEKTIIENSNFKNIYSASKTANIGLGTILEKNVYSVAQNITFNGTASGDVGITGNDITIGNNAVIEGDLNVSSDKEPELPADAVIGNYNFSQDDESDEIIVQNQKSFSSILEKIITYALIVCVLSIIFVNIAPNFTEKVRNYEIKDWIKSVSLGFALIVLVPIVTIILAFAGVAFRVAFALLLIYILSFLIATPIACYGIANIIAKKTEKKMVILYTLIVSLAYAILTLIPSVGSVFEIILGLMGYGCIFLSLIPKKDK